jgi:hypothetical protein
MTNISKKLKNNKFLKNQWMLTKNKKNCSWIYFGMVVLTPKGPNVYTTDKLVLVSVTWACTIFRYFETFCKDASRSKLCGKKIILFGPTD